MRCSPRSQRSPSVVIGGASSSAGSSSSSSPAERAKIIDKLLAGPEYVDHWTVKWSDLLQSSRKYLGEKGAYEFQQWIRDVIASNRPYDKLVRELLTARGSSYDNPAVNYFRVAPEAKPADAGAEDFCGPLMFSRARGGRAAPPGRSA